MKHIDPYSNQCGGLKPLKRILSLVALLLGGQLLVSCQSSSVPDVSASKPMVKVQWVKVSSQPPTYYPQGVSADCKTDCRSGQWVEAGDEQNRRFFIPFHGVTGNSREVFVDAALAERSEKKLAQIRSADQARVAKNVRSAVVGGPPMAGLIVMLAMVGADVDPDDLMADWSEEWHTSKAPK